MLNSPTFLSAILVGAALEFVAAEVVFAAALGLSVVAAALVWSLPRSRSQANLGVNVVADLGEPREQPL